MKVKSSALTGKALNWAVESIEIARMQTAGEYIKAWWVIERQSDPSPYSTDPLLAWPIIDREKITTIWRPTSDGGGYWWGCRSDWPGDEETIGLEGDTSLIAGMRCWVDFKLGEEVEIPDELLK